MSRSSGLNGNTQTDFKYFICFALFAYAHKITNNPRIRVSFVFWFWIDASLTLQTVYGSTHLITTTIFAINAQSKAIPKFLSIALDSIFCLAHNQRCTANFGQHKYECMLCVFIISLMSMFIWTIFLFASTKIVWNIYQKS